MPKIAAFGAVIAVFVVGGGTAVAAPDMMASHQDIAGAMREDMVGKATFDGSTITDVQQPSQCTTVFTTRSAKISIDWAHVSNPGIRTIGGKTDIELQYDDTVGHLVSPLPASEVRPSLTVLFGDCQPL